MWTALVRCPACCAEGPVVQIVGLKRKKAMARAIKKWNKRGLRKREQIVRQEMARLYQEKYARFEKMRNRVEKRIRGSCDDETR